MEIKHISSLPCSESQVTWAVAYLIPVIREVESKEIAAEYLSAHGPHKKECSQIQQIANATADVKDMVHMSISRRPLPAAGSRHSRPGCNYESDGYSHN